MSGMHTVRSFAREEYETNLFKRRNAEFQGLQLARDKKRRIYYLGRYTVFDLARMAVIIASSHKAVKGLITPGDIMLYITYLNYIVSPLDRLNRIYDQGNEAMKSIDDVMNILETEPDITDAPNAVALDRANGEIEFKNVVFNYSKKKEVIKGISFKVEAGQSVALVGLSGAGKTTITKLVTRFYDTTSGEVIIDGINVKDIAQKSLRQNVGMVMQDVMLFNDTIKNNIKYGSPNAKMEDVIAVAKAANIHDFIEKLPKGYNTLVGERGIRLSGGEKQRVSIARAVLKNPPILILDEATSNLDSHSEMLVQEALWKLIEKRTTIIIAHRLATVMKADKILILDDGKIAQQGTHQELVEKRGLYSKLFKIQSGAMLFMEKELKV